MLGRGIANIHLSITVLEGERGVWKGKWKLLLMASNLVVVSSIMGMYDVITVWGAYSLYITTVQGSIFPCIPLFPTCHQYLEVHGTYNLLSNCSYNPIIYRVTVIML